MILSFNFSLISSDRKIRYEEILPRVLAKYTRQQLDETLQQYENIAVLLVDSNRTKITLLTNS